MGPVPAHGNWIQLSPSRGGPTCLAATLNQIVRRISKESDVAVNLVNSLSIRHYGKRGGFAQPQFGGRTRADGDPAGRKAGWLDQIAQLPQNGISTSRRTLGGDETRR